MRLELLSDIAQKYTSNSQKARVVTENWVSENMYCPRCGCPRITQFENNRPVADFYCTECENQYELKSKDGTNLETISDGAYDTMINRITSFDNPDFLFMSYRRTDWQIVNLYFVPKYFFTPDIIQKRKPLSQNAKRAGWTGCNIKLSKIPTIGKIPIIENGRILDKGKILEKVSVADLLRVGNMEGRSWLFDVLNCVDLLPEKTFTLSDMYSFEEQLALKHPNNHNIRPRIRQQLQLLRDKGIIEFTNRGEYRRVMK